MVNLAGDYIVVKTEVERLEAQLKTIQQSLKEKRDEADGLRIEIQETYYQDAPIVLAADAITGVCVTINEDTGYASAEVVRIK